MAEQRRVKNQNFISKNKLRAAAWLVICIVVLLKTVFLNKKFQTQGLSFYVVTFTFVFLTAFIFARTLREVVGKAVGYRKSRNQYKNALQMMKTGSLAGLALGILMFFIFVLIAGRVTNLTFKLGAYGTFPMILFAVSLPFMFFSAAVLGCFDGFDFDMPDGGSKIIFGISDLLLSICLAFLAGGMGEKHAKLLHDDNVVSAFGATGAAAGFSGACILMAVWLFALFQAFRKKMKSRILEDTSRSQESFSEQIIGLLAACGTPFVRHFALFGSLLLEQILFFGFFKVPAVQSAVGNGPNYVWMYYILILFWFLLPFGMTMLLSKFSGLYLEKVMKKDDIYHCGMRIVLGIKQYLCFILPMVCVMGICCGASFSETAVLDRQFLPFFLVTIVCVLWGLAILEMAMLKGIGKEWLGIGCALGALVIQTIGTVLLFLKSCYYVKDILLCNLIGAVVFFAGCSLFLGRFCVYKKNLVHHILMPLSAAVVVVVASVLCMFLRKAIGNIPAVVITFAVSFVVHSITLIVVGAVKEGELHEFPQGKILGAIGRLMGIYK